MAGAGTYAILGGPAILTSRGQVASGGSFTQGVASGEPSPDAITLWTRVEDVSGNRRVELEIAREGSIEPGGEGAFDNVIHRDTVPIADGNPIVKTRVDDDLEPNTEYFYRFSTGEESSRVGRFRTARPADSNEPVRIAFFSCQEFVSGFYHAHRDLAEMDDIDIVLCLGDYVYEQAFDDDGVPERRDPTGEVFTLGEYRAKYNFYQTDQDLLAMRQAHPLMAIWDDHEVEDNYAAMLPGGQATKRPNPYRQRQAAGYRTFFEYMPRFPSGGSDTRIYTSIPLGNAEVFLLDTRQYRDNQVCAPGDSFVSLPGCPPTEYNKPGRTLLGKDQLEWLKDGLASSDARFKIVGTQVMIMSLDQVPGNPLNTDGWDGYGDERRELVDHIAENVSGEVTFVTGDIHTFFAGDVTRSGRIVPNDGSVEGDGIEGLTPKATEFVGGSITSKGILDRTTEDERVRDALDTGANGEVLVNNPHIRFSDQAFKGYAIVEAGVPPERRADSSTDELQVEYRRVCDVSSETDKSVDTLARFRVNGQPVGDGPRVVVLEDRSNTPCDGSSHEGDSTGSEGSGTTTGGAP